MRLSRLFKRDVVQIKQPQELYCLNYDCVEMVAWISGLSTVLDDEGINLSKDYCMNCLIEKLDEDYRLSGDEQ